MPKEMVDADGYRPNVGIVITNNCAQVFWARRVGGHNAWQFPQGGIDTGETPEQALYRELQEETGLLPENVTLLGQTPDWLRYDLPAHMRRRHTDLTFIGQKQKWFLLKLDDGDNAVRMDHHKTPEFDHWRWVSYYFPISDVVDFKRDVYRRALRELAPSLSLA